MRNMFSLHKPKYVLMADWCATQYDQNATVIINTTLPNDVQSCKLQNCALLCYQS